MVLKDWLNDLLTSLGAPKLGEPWTSQQKAIGIAVCVVLFPFVLAGFILYGMYRLLALWFTNRPKVVIKERRSPPALGGAVAADPRASGGFKTLCMFCNTPIAYDARRCPYCQKDRPHEFRQ